MASIKDDIVKLVKKVGGSASKIYVADQMCRKMGKYSSFQTQNVATRNGMLMQVEQAIADGTLTEVGDAVTLR